jgi:carbon monoxide dehydrogenase subunit G
MNVAVTEVDEPRQLVSVAEGQDSRLKERVKMTTALTLEPEGPTATRVAYRIDMGMYGKLASIGMAEVFVRKIKARLGTAA